MDVIEAIRTRRSIRRYRTTPVSDEVLHQVLEAARLSSSWANTQCVRFIIVLDAEVKAGLAATLITRPSEDGSGTRPNAAAEALIQAPMVIVACAELGKSGYFH